MPFTGFQMTEEKVSLFRKENTECMQLPTAQQFTVIYYVDIFIACIFGLLFVVVLHNFGRIIIKEKNQHKVLLVAFYVQSFIIAVCRITQFSCYSWQTKKDPASWTGNMMSIPPVFAKLSMGFC